MTSGHYEILSALVFFFFFTQPLINLMHSAWRRCYQCNHWRDVWTGPGNETEGAESNRKHFVLLALVIINPLEQLGWTVVPHRDKDTRIKEQNFCDNMRRATQTISFTSQAEFLALPQAVQYYVKPLLEAALWKPWTAIVCQESLKSICITHESAPTSSWKPNSQVCISMVSFLNQWVKILTRCILRTLKFCLPTAP